MQENNIIELPTISSVNKLPILRNEHGQYLKGVSGSPGGPRPGYKKKLNIIIEAIMDTFDGIGGQKAFELWASTHREQFYKMIICLIPKEMKIQGEGFGDTTIQVNPDRVLIFQDIKKEINVVNNGSPADIHVQESTGSNRT